MIRIVRVSPIRLTHDGDKAELRRIFGAGQTITVTPIGKTPERLIQEISAEKPDAIFLDTTPPPHSEAIRALAGELPVLEVIKVLRLTDSGEPTARYARALGRRNADTGDVETIGTLSDKALSAQATAHNL